MSPRLLFSLAMFFLLFQALGQETFPVNGVHDNREVYHAFTNAKIHLSPTETIDSGTLLIQDGRVVSVLAVGTLPGGSVVHDCEGLTIYPSFIDPDAIVEKAEKKKKGKKEDPQTFGASSWNSAIHPERGYKLKAPIPRKLQEDWLAIGYGLLNIHNRDGIMRGTSALIVLGENQPNLAIIKEGVTNHFSFNKGSSKTDYPTSHVGAIALIRQTLYDAQWYGRTSRRKEFNASLEALQTIDSRTTIIQLNHPLSIRNTNEISNEFELPFVLRGTGKEYLVREELNPTGQIIAPLSFPLPYSIEDPFEARMTGLDQLKHWELAPFNMKLLIEAQAEVSLTRDTSKAKEVIQNLTRISNTGVSHSNLLAALTINPARILGLENEISTLHSGKRANFFLSKEELGSESFEVLEHWTNGVQAFKKTITPDQLIGRYNLVIEEKEYAVTILKVSENGIEAEIKSDVSEQKLKTTVKVERELLTVNIWSSDPAILVYSLSGKLSFNQSVWDGRGQNAKGKWISWAAIRDRKYEPQAENEKATKDTLSVPKISFPNCAYGWDSLDENTTFLITNAIVWTCADTGRLKNTDVYVVDGKIKSIGSGQLFPSDVKRIDARGRHLTPGIIDEHSHIGLRGGVNEWGQSSSAEVRMGDALDPWNVNIYRQLAGGVTTAQLLHGSANPIGGQSALVKYKWGRSATEMLIDEAPGFIKFALGENVKRSNRKEDGGRFPLTRMGVEQVFADAFTRAREYDPNERVDLDLEAVQEILDSSRFVTCHSYVQSEILMLMDVADQFDFRVNTFTHILEGYKIAPLLAEHGAGGSTFSDWWAYKYEVNDAIPYNAAIMTKAGVNVGINSDDAEMGRRLNQEAAKAVKYGGLSEEEAMKLVTINPAKMLHLDDQIGSIEVGKDADLVLWSDHPLSVYSKAEKTFIEGVKYFDIKDQAELETQISRERSRIIALMNSAKGKKVTAKSSNPKLYHCDSLEDE
ncbi:MAG: amidohydrolase family protein [Flavobacteriales bacterium]|jgi:imidazolonepropionase-like amidohydrolase|nr:amidohydrolase family protein [Flavobacteriales bacterium]MBT4703906.1 amidohydrolase family protein [Flavobacteriales bacterium]MBT6917485.1 amidohydrolase family protein [Flavobacteriales bacterium]MBT7687025.1 amidohydrolase family protein [Flavobacteriales bacterium]MBT7750588.1 amidohydrolase family protein [Flavobacteriales bacterium]